MILSKPLREIDAEGNEFIDKLIDEIKNIENDLFENISRVGSYKSALKCIEDTILKLHYLYNKMHMHAIIPEHINANAPMKILFKLELTNRVSNIALAFALALDMCTKELINSFDDIIIAIDNIKELIHAEEQIDSVIAPIAIDNVNEQKLTPDEEQSTRGPTLTLRTNLSRALIHMQFVMIKLTSIHEKYENRIFIDTQNNILKKLIVLIDRYSNPNSLNHLEYYKTFQLNVRGDVSTRLDIQSSTISNLYEQIVTINGCFKRLYTTIPSEFYEMDSPPEDLLEIDDTYSTIQIYSTKLPELIKELLAGYDKKKIKLEDAYSILTSFYNKTESILDMIDFIREQAKTMPKKVKAAIAKCKVNKIESKVPDAVVNSNLQIIEPEVDEVVNSLPHQDKEIMATPITPYKNLSSIKIDKKSQIEKNVKIIEDSKIEPNDSCMKINLSHSQKKKVEEIICGDSKKLGYNEVKHTILALGGDVERHAGSRRKIRLGRDEVFFHERHGRDRSECVDPKVANEIKELLSKFVVKPEAEFTINKKKKR